MSDWFFKTGHVSKAELVNTGTALRNFPLQSDMNNGRVWIRRPADGADIVVPANFVDSISGHRYAYGGYEFQYKLWSLSPKMVKYIKDTFFPNSYSSQITVMLYNRANGEWEAYNAIAKYPNVRDEAAMAMGGLNEFTITFTKGTFANEGPDVYPIIDDSNDWTALSNSTITIEVTNGGDDVTFDDVITTVELDSKTVYVSSTYSGWTISYSTNNGTSYSGTPPMDLADITHLRYTRSDALAESDSYGDIVITLNSTTSGSGTLTITATTTGDTDNTNDSEELVITIA